MAVHFLVLLPDFKARQIVLSRVLSLYGHDGPFISVEAQASFQEIAGRVLPRLKSDDIGFSFRCLGAVLQLEQVAPVAIRANGVEEIKVDELQVGRIAREGLE